MIGTNDISGGSVPDGYRAGLKKIVQKCLDAHCADPQHHPAAGRAR
jgi:hypothetical protein